MRQCLSHTKTRKPKALSHVSIATCSDSSGDPFPKGKSAAGQQGASRLEDGAYLGDMPSLSPR